MGMFLTLDCENLKAWNLVSLNHGLGGALRSFLWCIISSNFSGKALSQMLVYFMYMICHIENNSHMVWLHVSAILSSNGCCGAAFAISKIFNFVDGCKSFHVSMGAIALWSMKCFHVALSLATCDSNVHLISWFCITFVCGWWHSYQERKLIVVTSATHLPQNGLAFLGHY